MAGRTNQRDDNEQSPQAVDHAGNRGQQFDELFEQVLDWSGTLHQKGWR